MYSEDSEEEYNETNYYRKKYSLLVEKCELLQQTNEMLVHRLQRMKKLLRRTRKQRVFLMNWLDRYHDDWRNSDYPLDIGLAESGSYVDLIQNQEFVERSPMLTTNKNLMLPPPPPPPKTLVEKRARTKSGKRKERRAEKDPNAPKRPANPFFQFCQEQRPVVLDHMITQGKGEPTKQDLTKQLAATWNDLPRKDKKVYYDKYMKSKEQYIANMEQYTRNKAKEGQDAFKT